MARGQIVCGQLTGGHSPVKVHKGRALVAVAAAVLLGLTACSTSSSGGGNQTDTSGTKGTGNLADCSTSPTTCNSGKTQSGGTMAYVLEKTIPGWNQVYSPSNVFEVAEVEDGILPGVYLAGSDLKPFLNSNLMDSAEQTKTNPQTLVYKIKQNAVWDDGQPINFDDFKYLKDVSDGTTCPKCGASSSAGYNAIQSMTGSDNGKTVTVVMKTPFADWQSMFGALLPAHIAAQHGGTSGASGLNESFQWFDKNVPNYSGGPYKISSYTKDQSITEVPNPKWYGSTKPSLSKLVFRIITDQTQEPTALQNNEVQAIYPQPSQDLVDAVSKIQGVSTYIGKGLVWEHFDFNEKNQFLKDKTLRQAIFTAINRQDIINRTIGTFVPGAKPLGNHIYVPGQPGYQDNVTSTKQGSGDLDLAKQMLTKAGYKGVGSSLMTPSGQHVQFRCTYSEGNTNRQTECQVAQTTLKKLGIDITLKTTPDLAELGTGDFDMIVFAWVGTPFVVAGAQQIYELKGGADYGFNNDPAAEKLINEAAVQTDQTKVQSLLNKADKLITTDAYELPLYQKPTYLAVYNKYVNIRDNATASGPPVNVQDWGVKAS
jgi:peptide/nickel transport system substrate-binding protein